MQMCVHTSRYVWIYAYMQICAHICVYIWFYVFRLPVFNFWLSALKTRLKFVIYYFPGLSTVPVLENKKVTFYCFLIVASICLFIFTASKGGDGLGSFKHNVTFDLDRSISTFHLLTEGRRKGQFRLRRKIFDFRSNALSPTNLEPKR